MSGIQNFSPKEACRYNIRNRDSELILISVSDEECVKRLIRTDQCFRRAGLRYHERQDSIRCAIAKYSGSGMRLNEFFYNLRVKFVGCRFSMPLTAR